jgi:hypothetical protein
MLCLLYSGGANLLKKDRNVEGLHTKINSEAQVVLLWGGIRSYRSIFQEEVASPSWTGRVNVSDMEKEEILATQLATSFIAPGCKDIWMTPCSCR